MYQNSDALVIPFDSPDTYQAPTKNTVMRVPTIGSSLVARRIEIKTSTTSAKGCISYTNGKRAVYVLSFDRQGKELSNEKQSYSTLSIQYKLL
jgi:hypothetical protein